VDFTTSFEPLLVVKNEAPLNHL